MPVLRNYFKDIGNLLNMINLSLYQKEVFENYKSNSQRARVLTENWFNSQMYCPSCLNNSVTSYPNNKKVYDFLCDKCKTDYQLKALSKKFTNRVLDGEFNTMIREIFCRLYRYIPIENSYH